MAQTVTLELPLLPEPYPGPENEQSPSYAWCFALWQALHALQRYTVVDGSRAVLGWVRFSHEYCSELSAKEFGKDKRNEIEARNDHPERGWWVCDLDLQTHDDHEIDSVEFYAADFRNNGDAARAKFARVIEHLRRHAIPQVPPAWLDRAISVLQGNE